MNRTFFLMIFVAAVCQVAPSSAVVDEFTVDAGSVGTESRSSGDKRRYTQVRDDLIELLGEVMELTVTNVERLADLQLSEWADADLRRTTGRLIKTLVVLQREVCRTVRKVAEGVAGMSCKRLKNLEKRFIAARKVLRCHENCFAQKKLEKTGKSDQACREKLREDLERMMQDLCIT